ncbi:MAG: hypothetical protein ICV77_14445 [Cyanobacteria bacterium Co-bin8]|nr:hypothetical protein [Cyanobacteria bacterium Co-bin8]
MLQTVEKQATPVKTAEQKQPNPILFQLVSWLFLIGSLIFQVDAIIEWTEGFSVHVALHLLASFLFTVGSVLFVVHDSR